VKFSDVKDLLILAAVGYGIYWIYKKLPSFQQVATTANEAKNLLTSSPVTPTGQIRLPSGQVIAVNDVVQAGGVVDQSGNFTWNGTRYTIYGLGPDGVYEVM
jgi:hypothetical protein